MKNKFTEESVMLRDETLQNILIDKTSWNRFITYWSNILDKYSVDNILNLYAYNSSGKVFMTYDEWNSDEIDRRIKPKSKGIPIFSHNGKVYVFDIKQTYGKKYEEWQYNHQIDNAILEYYQNSINLNRNDNKNQNENFYDTHYNI